METSVVKPSEDLALAHLQSCPLCKASMSGSCPEGRRLLLESAGWKPRQTRKEKE